jgi:uncharacterized protein
VIGAGAPSPDSSLEARLAPLRAEAAARLFATTSEMRRPLHDPEDPLALRRAPDDKAFGLDHAFRKLRKIPDLLHTATAREMARERAAFVEAFVAQMAREVG